TCALPIWDLQSTDLPERCTATRFLGHTAFAQSAKAYRPFGFESSRDGAGLGLGEARKFGCRPSRGLDPRWKGSETATRASARPVPNCAPRASRENRRAEGQLPQARGLWGVAQAA